MGFFSKNLRSKAPSNLAALLADYGRQQFNRASGASLDQATDAFLTSISYPKPDAERLPLIEAVRTTGLREGGWAASGAWEVLFANFLSPVPQDVLDQLSEARVKFFLTLERPDIYQFMNIEDSMTLKRIDPAAYERISPF